MSHPPVGPGRPNGPGGVRGDRDFLAFWVGETASLVGMEVTHLVLPLVAILTLNATTFQVGLINAVLYAPAILFSLLIGVWLDRHRRRSALVVSNAARTALVGLVPLAAATSLLTLPMLYVITFLLGTLTVIFEVGSLSYLPTLVDRRYLADANGRIQASFSVAAIAGPSLGGLLAGVFTAPVALTASALGFALSVVMTSAIRRPEPAPSGERSRSRVLAEVSTPPASPGGRSRSRSLAEVSTPQVPQRTGDTARIGDAVREGLRTVFADSMLRNLLTQSAAFNAFHNALVVVFVVYVTRSLGLHPQQLGVVLGSAAVAALLGALLTTRITRALGLGNTLRTVTYVVCLSPMLILIPRDAGAVAIVLLVISHAISGFGLVVWNINALTIRQVVTPDRLLGRMNASYRMVLFGAIPVGALLGGALGDLVGLRTALLIVVVLLTTPILWTFFSPVFQVTHMPTGPRETGRAQPEPGFDGGEHAPSSPGDGPRMPGTAETSAAGSGGVDRPSASVSRE